MTTSAASSGSASTHIPIFGVGTTTIPVSGVAGRIVGADSTATTIALNCLNDTSCAIGTNPLTFTQGPSTLVADIVTQTDIEGYSGTITAAVDAILFLAHRPRLALLPVRSAWPKFRHYDYHHYDYSF